MTTQGITIRNNYPVGPESPTVEIDRGTDKAKTTDIIRPQESAPLGDGELTIRIVFPKGKDEEGKA